MPQPVPTSNSFAEFAPLPPRRPPTAPNPFDQFDAPASGSLAPNPFAQYGAQPQRPTSGPAQLPPGFVLDAPTPAKAEPNPFAQFAQPAQPGRAPAPAAGLPPGFVLDPPPAAHAPTANFFDQFDVPARTAAPRGSAELPPGFVLDAPPPAATPNPFARFVQQPAAPPAVAEPNPFMQFVQQPTAPAAQSAAPAANFFDQFDAPAQAAAPRPRDPATVQAEFDAKPWYAKAGQAADDVVRLIANGMTFGYADKMAGTLGGQGADAERARTQEARDRAGWAGAAAEVGGSMAVPMGTGATLVGRFGTGAMQGAGGLAARMGLGAAEGAGYGALSAAGHDQNLSDGAIAGALFGAAAQPVAQAVTGAVGRMAGAVTRQPNVPTPDQLRQAADAAYAASENAGVVFTPQMVDRVRQRVTGELANYGYHPELQPGARVALGELDALAGQNVSLKGLDQLRKIASNGYQQGNNSNNSVVNMLIGALDDAIANPQAGDVLAGDATRGVAALQEARGLWARLAKSETANRAIDYARDRAAVTGKGGNVDNATRQEMLRLSRNPRGYTADEIDALRRVIMPSTAQNALRAVGAFAPTGVVSSGMGLGVGGQLGGMVGGPLGAGLGAVVVPAVGWAAKRSADRMTARNTDELVRIIRGGGTRAAAVAPPNAVQRAAAVSRDDLARAIMMDGNGY